MGRFAKNQELKTASHAIRLPMGSNSVGPSSPVNGQVRFNINNPMGLEFYNDGQWHSNAAVGRVAIVKDSFVGNGSDMAFTPMSVSHAAGNETDILVFVGNVFQEPGIAYVVNGVNITFTSAPNLGLPIVILHNFNSTQTV